MLGLYLYLEARGASVVPAGAGRAILIPIVVNVIGDGLAEPVGIAWGRHEYRARALWYRGRFCAGEFKRTLEGSAVVYVTALAAIAPMYRPLGLFSGGAQSVLHTHVTRLKAQIRLKDIICIHGVV